MPDTQSPAAGEKPLTPTQAKVMAWLIGGHQPHIHAGASVHVNGKRVCNLDTMNALEKRGFAEKVGRYQWRITLAGGAYMESLRAEADDPTLGICSGNPSWEDFPRLLERYRAAVRERDLSPGHYDGRDIIERQPHEVASG